MKLINCLCSERAKRDEFALNIDQNKNETALRIQGSRILQYSAVLSVSLVSMGLGSAEIWTSPALPYLRSNNSSGFTINQNQASWVASLYNIGTILGFLLYPLLVDRIGRKYTLLIFSIPQTLSSIMIFFAKNVITLYLARIISGIGYGGAFTVQIMYISEISDKNKRGILIFISRLFYSFGAINVYTAAAFLSYDNMNLLILLFPILFILTFIFMPESPYFYLKHNREKEALASLRKFQGSADSETIQVEIKRMKDALIEEERSKKSAFKILLQDKRNRKALVIVAIVLGCLMFSGIRVFAAYSQDILSLCNLSISPQYSLLILTCVVTLCVLPTAPLLDYVGRRIMVLSSGIICALTLIIIGLLFFLKDYLQITNFSSYSWIFLVAFIVFEISCTAGLFPASIVIAGELFSSQVKSTALSVLYVTKELVTFFMKLSFAFLVSKDYGQGIYGGYGGYAPGMPYGISTTNRGSWSPGYRGYNYPGVIGGGNTGYGYYGTGGYGGYGGYGNSIGGYGGYGSGYGGYGTGFGGSGSGYGGYGTGYGGSGSGYGGYGTGYGGYGTGYGGYGTGYGGYGTGYGGYGTGYGTGYGGYGNGLGSGYGGNGGFDDYGYSNRGYGNRYGGYGGYGLGGYGGLYGNRGSYYGSYVGTPSGYRGYSK